MKNDNRLLLEFYEKMLMVRRFEEKVYELAHKDVVRGPVHVCVGEEATAVGTCMAIEKEDYIIPSHRGHGQGLVKGASPERFLAEIIGKETGLCKGRVGSIHFFDKDNNNIGAQGILGAQFPIAVGVGLAIKLKKLNSCVLCFFGDGTSNQGSFYESLNFAALWDLPIIFVCINNLYGMGTPYSRTCNINIHKKGDIFSISSYCVDGNDVLKVYAKMKEIVEMVKKDRKPALIECKTYRWHGHSSWDNRKYRPGEEVEEWLSKDPIKRLKGALISNGIKEEEIESINKNVNNLIKNAEKFALDSKYPIFDISMEC